jgi:tetratricopeptide (TPR) repeat protein
MASHWHIAVDVFWVTIVTAFVIWLFILSFKNSESPGLLIFKWAMTIPVVAFLWLKIGPMIPEGGADTIAGMLMAAVGMVILALVWRSSLIESLINPFTSIFDGGNLPPERKPYYSTATARRKRGQYLDAIVAIREQLANFPDDFEGIMLLASIQAEDMKDLPSAETTLDHFCAQADSPEKQIAAAWTTLADWHLKIGVDVYSARASLQKIVERFPGTELALRAENRIAHLVGTEKILMDQHDRPTITVPEGVKNLGLLDSTEFMKPQEIEPGKLAAAHVKHLETHPHDAEVREKLALIYAKDFQRLDLATMELQQLINEPRHSPKQIAGWLNLLANLQIEAGADVATVTATLQHIVDRYPDLPLAEITRRRLMRINSEFKGKEKGAGVKLGTYEQNIGLKYGSPRKL